MGKQTKSNLKKNPSKHSSVLCILPGSGLQLNLIFEPQHEISNNVVCAASKASDQPAHMRSLIRAFASRLDILGMLSY